MIVDGEREARAWFQNALSGSDTQIDRLDQLVALLRSENERQNLVSASSLDQVWVRHLADSAQLLVVSRETPRGPWLDLGSGAGFPGLVVAVCRPDLQVVLVESRTKRAEWLNRTSEALGLHNVRVETKRLETLASFGAATISARAFAPLPRLIALSARFSTSETLWLLPKGQNGRQELQILPQPLQSMFHVEQSLTDPRSVVLVGHGRPAP